MSSSQTGRLSDDMDSPTTNYTVGAQSLELVDVPKHLDSGELGSQSTADEKGEYDALLADVQAAKAASPAAYYFAWPAIRLRMFLTKHAGILKLMFYIALVLTYFGILIAGCIINWGHGQVMLALTGVAVTFIAWDYFVGRNWDEICLKMEPVVSSFTKNYTIWKWLFIGTCVVLFLGWIIIDTWGRPEQLISLLGIFVYVTILVFVSHAPHKINWRPVLWGFGLTFVVALIVLRTAQGAAAFGWLADQMAVFLSYSGIGSAFLFSENYWQFLAFDILPLVIFFSAVVSFLYYIGFMMYIIRKFAWLMEFTLQTSGPESIVAAGNIFVGMIEAPLMIRPFLDNLTPSELTAIMTSGFASIAGSVLGAYMSFGVPPTDLLAASVTSAPAALACAKIVVPETQKSEFAKSSDLDVDKMEAENFIDAISLGITSGIPLAVNIGAMLCTFVSLLGFLDAVCVWVGEMLGFFEPPLTMSRLLGYVFFPFAYLMGVKSYDCGIAGELIGLRVFVNEFVAFANLGEMMELRQAGEPKYLPDGTQQWLDVRSESIVTYALCGFANIGSMGITIGGLSGIAPGKRKDIVKYVVPAIIAGNLACFIRAAVAGLVYEHPAV